MGMMQQMVAKQVRTLFADQQGNSVTISTEDGGLLGQRAISRRVHGDVTTMMIGGMASLMVQMLHPAALAGVWDHSRFRTDPAGRLRRTAAFIAEATYGDTAQARAAIDRVNRIHRHVRGTLPDGTEYAANDPALLAWVHAGETLYFLKAYVRYREPLMTLRAQNRYFQEQAMIGTMLGARDLPETRNGMERLLRSYRPELRFDERTQTMSQMLREQAPANPSLAPFQRLVMQAAIDLLPGWILQMHGLKQRPLGTPIIRSSALGMTAMLNWAMKG